MLESYILDEEIDRTNVSTRLEPGFLRPEEKGITFSHKGKI